MKAVWGILLLAFLGACGFTGEVGVRPWDVLVVNNMADPAFLDPGLQSAAEDQRITLALFEGLVTPHPKTLEPLPGVAQHWTVSADGLVYRFTLRSCQWSDGVAVTASDFLYAWRRVLTPTSGNSSRKFADQGYYVSAPYVDVVFAIRGAKAWHQGRLGSFDQVGIRVIDEHNLEVTLEQPTPWFLELLSFPTFAPVPRHVVERHGRDWTRVENFVGNGPFKLTERRQGDLLRVRRSETYWDREAVGLGGIDYLSTDQVDTAIDQFLAGESDWVRSFNPKKVRAWRRDQELTTYLRAPEFLATFFFRLNMGLDVFKDPRVRRALSLAIDRESITRYVTGLGEVATSRFVPDCLTENSPWPKRQRSGSFQPEEARELLAACGFPRGQGFPVITIAFNTDVKNRAIAEAVQQMWAKELGITVLLENREKKVHFAKERAGDYIISRGNWIGDFSDPITFLDVFRSDGSSNRCGWQNNDYDSLLDRAASELDEVRRLSLLEKAEHILCVEDPPIIPIFFYRTAYLLKPGRFSGIYENSRNIHPPKHIRPRNS